MLAWAYSSRQRQAHTKICSTHDAPSSKLPGSQAQGPAMPRSCASHTSHTFQKSRCPCFTDRASCNAHGTLLYIHTGYLGRWPPRAAQRLLPHLRHPGNGGWASRQAGRPIPTSRQPTLPSAHSGAAQRVKHSASITPIPTQQWPPLQKPPAAALLRRWAAG
jgi:hypothetical protein